MPDIKELEGRISAALARVSTALMQIPAATAVPEMDPAEMARMTEALESEKNSNAMLEERVKALQDKQKKLVAGLEAEVVRLTAELAERDGLTGQLRRVNEQLRANNMALRGANAKGQGDAHLINQALKIEVESLSAIRDADRVEIDAVLAELKPLVGEDANA